MSDRQEGEMPEKMWFKREDILGLVDRADRCIAYYYPKEWNPNDCVPYLPASRVTELEREMEKAKGLLKEAREELRWSITESSHALGWKIDEAMGEK